MGELLQGPCHSEQLVEAYKMLQKAAIVAPVDFTRTAISGTVGLFQTTGDEVAYLVDPNGTKISAINPKRKSYNRFWLSLNLNKSLNLLGGKGVGYFITDFFYAFISRCKNYRKYCLKCHL